ncbi:MAG TPA: recombinase family protein [Verrucomicrobiota bacterium]|nr:recombinase family protein [Verrucomicrobiota bacterium]
MKTKAFNYLRVSGKGQIDGDGFPRQRSVCEAYAKRHQIEIEREFCEKGVSGTKDAFDREALTDLFVALKANGVRVVLVERADRLARDLMISEILLGEFRKLGVKVISAECGTELTVEDNDPTKKLIRQVLGAISEWEKSVIVQKLRAARMRMRKSEGRCEGRKPYGTTEEEKAVIGKMLELRSEGLSLAEIANRLNADGIKPRTAQAGKETKWHPTTIQRILHRRLASLAKKPVLAAEPQPVEK